ncbi:Amino acid transporter AVT1C [Linum perenne]
MKNSASDESLNYVDSEEDEDSKEVNAGEGKKVDDRVVVIRSGSEEAMDPDRQQSSFKPGSHTPSWPQSYRASMDMYTSVSPTINFLKSPMSRQGSSFLTTSFRRRRTSELLPSSTTITEAAAAATTVPLLYKEEEDEDEKYRTLKQQRSSLISLGIPAADYPTERKSSFGQAVLNGVNVLCGIGILSTPYAVKEGGWLGLGVLLVFALLSFYTGLLLRYCLDSQPGLETYPDIGQAAFGTTGRIAFAACCVEYIILESDNLSALFPNAHLNIGGLELDPRHLFALLATLAVLPTVWLRDLSILSYISAGGVVATILVVICLFWGGLVEDVGIHSRGTFLNLGTLPVAIGLYGYCYQGHAVFPNIYSSMAKPNQYPSVLVVCFVTCTAMYVGVGIMGYTMFGEATQSQFTLNMPAQLLTSKIAVWTTVVNPFTKYALTMTPVAMSLEELIPANKRSYFLIISIRTLLVISTLVVAISVPFFGQYLSIYQHVSFNFSTPRSSLELTRSFSRAGPVLSLIGSLLTMFVVCLSFFPSSHRINILMNHNVIWFNMFHENGRH